MIPVDLEGMSISELRTFTNKLRTEYKMFKDEHPLQQNEEIINEFLLIREELKKRKKSLRLKDHPLDNDSRAFIKIASIKPVSWVPPKEITFGEGLAEVKPSGEIQGSRVKLADLEPQFKDFYVVAPCIWLVGGVAEHPEEGTQNDADILISVPTQEELEEIIKFRLYRMVDTKLRNRLHFLAETKGYVGPFTDSLALYRLKLERIPDTEIEEMVEISLRTKGTEKQEKEANKALRSKKITPGEFFLMAKPVRGYYPSEPQTLDLFLDIYEKYYEYPALSSKKFDGEHISIQRIGKKTEIFSEDGSAITGLNNLKNEVQNLRPEVCVIEAELEKWDYEIGSHYPRETVDTGVENDQFTANVFDCLYYKGEIPDELYEEMKFFEKEGKEKWKEKYL